MTQQARQLAWSWGLDEAKQEGSREAYDGRERVYPVLTVSVRQMEQLVFESLSDEISKADLRALLKNRPETRADCKDGLRPCPYVGCIHNLYLEVNWDNGSIKYNFPDVEPDEMRDSCALDLIDENPGGMTLEEVGRALNLTREAVRLIEETAKWKQKFGPLREFREEGHEVSKRHLHVIQDEDE